MATSRHTEQVEIDFLLFGDIQEFCKLYGVLERSLQKARNLAGELEGRLCISSYRGHSLTLAGNPLYHGDFTIEFHYTSKTPLQQLVNEHILPGLIEGYVMPHLNSGRCVVLKDMHSRGYYGLMATQIANEDQEIKRLSHNIPQDFIEQILGAQSPDAR